VQTGGSSLRKEARGGIEWPGIEVVQSAPGFAAYQERVDQAEVAARQREARTRQACEEAARALGLTGSEESVATTAAEAVGYVIVDYGLEPDIAAVVESVARVGLGVKDDGGDVYRVRHAIWSAAARMMLDT
jgi:hypothetical protein